MKEKRNDKNKTTVNLFQDRTRYNSVEIVNNKKKQLIVWIYQKDAICLQNKL